MCSRLSRKQRKKDELEKKLYFAISDNDVEALESLIKNGINVDSTFYGTNQLQKTAMHLCCEKGHLECAKLLYNAGASVEPKDAWYQTPLMYSVCTERPDMVEFLLKCGCNLDEHDRFGKTALHFAVTNNTTDCLKLLLEYGADVHSVEELGRTPLWVAASEDGHHDAIVCLLEAGADVNMTDRREKRTPLHAAIRHTKKDTVLYLKTFLDAGSVVNTVDESGHSPLSTLIQNGSMFSPITKDTVVMAKMLLAAGFDVNLSKPSSPRQLYGTALKAAVNRGSLVLVDLLLESGADPDIHDQRCVTPLIWSAYHNQLDISKSLVSANCDLDAVGRVYVNHEFHRATAFHCAMLLEHFGIAKLLVMAGCDLGFETYLITNEDVPMILVKNYEFWGWLRDVAINPKSLSEMCRKLIRKHIGFDLRSKVEQLPLPTKLKHYILLKEILGKDA